MIGIRVYSFYNGATPTHTSHQIHQSDVWEEAVGPNVVSGLGLVAGSRESRG